jgi:MFS family permease
MSVTAVTTHDTVYRKIGWRLLPFLLACYIINYLDRVSIGYAKLQFQSDLHINEAVFGLIASAFAVGYIIFEVPSNLLLLRIGAPATLARIMTLWGATIVAMMFAQNEYWFYVLRFLLGAFEAGFFPGVLLYLSFWYPNHQRGRATSWFLVGLPMSGILGGAISGGVMSMLDGVLGLRGWRWLFFVDGAPAILLGLFAMVLLTDRPENAKFLTDQEKKLIADDLEADRRARTTGVPTTVLESFRSVWVWLMVVIYGGGVLINTNNIWFPTILKSVGMTSVANVGYVLSLAWAFGSIVVLLVCRNSDRVGERRWHLLVTGLISVAAYYALPLAHDSVLGTAILIAVGLAFGYSNFMVFWTLPPVFLEARAAAAGIAIISSLGQWGGLSGPALVGWLYQSTGSIYIGYDVAATGLLISALLATFVLPHARARKPGPVV